jgi:hypothetical protein
MATPMEEETTTRLMKLSFKIPFMDYQTGRQELRKWKGDEAMGDLLRALIETNTL